MPDYQNLHIHDSDCSLVQACTCSNYIERKTSLKYLGIYLDQNFTWKEHLAYVTSKARKLIFKFYELRNILTLSTLKVAYCALVESIINYGIVVWGGAGVTILSKLQVAQKYIIKTMLFKNKRYPTELVFKESELLDVRQMHLRAIVRFMLRVPYYKESINHGVNTRSAAQNSLARQNPRHTVCQFHIYSLGPKVFNGLPTNIRNKPYHKCKKEIKQWIRQSNYKIHYTI